MLFTPLLVRLRLRYGVRFVVFCLAGEYAYLSSAELKRRNVYKCFRVCSELIRLVKLQVIL